MALSKRNRRIWMLAGVLLGVAWAGTTCAGTCDSGLGLLTVKGYVGTRFSSMLKNHLVATDVGYLTAPFSEKTERREWWQTEFWGKYMHAAVPFRALAADPRLDANVEKGVEAIMASQEPNGYIGNYPDDLRCGRGWDVWGMKYTMMGLLHYYDGTLSGSEAERRKGDSALEACKRLCDYLIAEIGPSGNRGHELWKTGNWCGYASSSVLEPVVWLYRRIRLRPDFGGQSSAQKYLDFATYIVKGMTEPEAGPRLLDLALKGVKVAERNGYGNQEGYSKEGDWYVCQYNRSKAYEMMSCYQGLVAYARETDRKDLLDAAVRTAEQIVRDEINIAGGCTRGEAWFNGREKQHQQHHSLQETCVIVTWMRLCETLLDETGDVKWADELEKSFYNAYLASLSADASEFAAYTPLNGSRFSGHHHCFMHTNCCNANGPRGFLSFLRATLTARATTAYLNFYLSGSAQVELPQGGTLVKLESYTEYPKTGFVRIVNHTETKLDFTLATRIPSWSERTSVKVNGAPAEVRIVSGQYALLKRTWQPGDVVEIEIDMAVRMHELDHAVAFSRGPVALARDTRFDDGPIDEVIGWRRLKQVPSFSPTRVLKGGMWMAFSASLPLGSHQENPEGATPTTVRFCDYASAGALWQPTCAYRVWIPIEY